MLNKSAASVRCTFASVFIALLAMTVPAIAVEPEAFQVRTTTDFVALCGAKPASSNYVAAIHFCEGFASGAYRYYQSLAAVSPSDRYICPPDPEPSRDQVIAGFVEWANTNHAAMSAPAIDSLFRYLGAKYPCQK